MLLIDLLTIEDLVYLTVDELRNLAIANAFNSPLCNGFQYGRFIVDTL